MSTRAAPRHPPPPSADARLRRVLQIGLEQLETLRLMAPIGVNPDRADVACDPKRPRVAQPTQPHAPLSTQSLDPNPMAERPFVIDNVPEISAAGGRALWTRMRELEQGDYIGDLRVHGGNVADMGSEEDRAKFAVRSLEQSLRCLTGRLDFQSAQLDKLRDAYGAFMSSINELRRVEGGDGVGYEYTAGSRRFNNYLLYRGVARAQDIPEYNDCYDDLGPPKDVHRLYKLIAQCPGLTETATFFRSVTTVERLPHVVAQLGEGAATNRSAKVGQSYLNATFMSTSAAPPEAYMAPDGLGKFYDRRKNCCMCAITCPPGMPVLPLVLGGSDCSRYPYENEVLLPPGIMLIYQGKRNVSVSDAAQNVHKMTVRFYLAAPPVDRAAMAAAAGPSGLSPTAGPSGADP